MRHNRTTVSLALTRARAHFYAQETWTFLCMLQERIGDRRSNTNEYFRFIGYST